MVTGAGVLLKMKCGLVVIRHIVRLMKQHYLNGVSALHVYEYQKLAARTLINEPDNEYNSTELMLLWDAMGLAGETGEVCDIIKKFVFHRHSLDLLNLTKELGDVLWYVAALCSTLGISISSVMEMNISKLQTRYPDGYSSE